LHRLFIKKTVKVNSKFEINDEQAHHLFNVLRMKLGDKVEIVDLDSNVYIGSLVENYKIQILEEIISTTEPKVKVSIFQGVPKKDKFEQVIKMATEVGATDFTVVKMKRSVVKIKEEKIDKLLNRWRRIVLSAAKQSKRQEIPTINKPISFKNMINKFNDFDLIVCLYENENNTTIRNIDINNDVRKLAIIVGPEGGFSEDEINQLKEQEVNICSLGPRIMRTETAGIVALSIILYITGDI